MIMENQSSKKETGSGGGIKIEGISNLIDNSSKIVIKAANILEEEIAKGIITAKQMEEKYTNIEKLRSVDNDALFNRFRRDAHDIIDLLLDFAAIAAKNVSQISSQWISVKTEPVTTDNAKPENVNIPLIRVPGELKQNEYFELPVRLENESKTDSKSLHFVNSAFSGSGDDHMPASIISFDPNPLVVPPGSSSTVLLKITIPGDAKGGSYSCLIEAKSHNDLKATLILKVING
jgi:hypothetical protein